MLGYFADDFKVSGKFYTASYDKSPYKPFCAKVYQFELTTSERQKDTQGVVSLILKPGTNEQEEYKFTVEDTKIKANDVIKGMIISHLNIGKIEGTQLKFVKKSGFCLFNCNADEIIFHKVKIQYYDNPLTYVFFYLLSFFKPTYNEIFFI